MKINSFNIIALFGFMLLVFSGCTEKDAEPDPSDGINWEIGAITTYFVSGGLGLEVDDSITGGTFIFPEGANGELEVAVITSGPIPPLEGDMFWISYESGDPLKLMLPRNDDAFVYLHGFGSSNGSFDDSISGDERWHCLPAVDTIDNNIVFHLIMPFTARKTMMSSPHRGFTHHQIARIPNGSSRADTIRASHSQASDFINIILDSLPPSIQTAARTEVAGRLAPAFYSSGNYYKGFYYISSYFPRAWPMISITPFTSAGFIDDVIAHEVGHYMNHVIVGDDIYVILEAQAPSELHGPGDLNAGRSIIVEDYAFFAEYFLTGTIGRDVDPTLNLMVLTRLGEPYSIDFPSIEGFACFLLANLHRTRETIPKLTSPGLDSIPVVGASFQDIWGIIARGATDINQLRTHIEEYLTAEGKEDMLPVIAQRIGWRYWATGTVMTDDGGGTSAPLENANVVQIAYAGGRAYRNLIRTTDENGEFLLYDVFPGNTTLRIFFGNDSTDHPLDIDWDTPTTEIIELGELFMTGANMFDFLRTTDYISISVSGSYVYTNGYSGNGFTLESRVENAVSSWTCLPLNWSGNNASANGILTDRWGGENTININLSLSSNGQDLTSVFAEHTRESEVEEGYVTYKKVATNSDVPLYFWYPGSNSAGYELKFYETDEGDFEIEDSQTRYGELHEIDYFNWPAYVRLTITFWCN
ncbi:carboxypeptidase regulatory-like domain-containing protein [bacterium]|nr:carboxypeptidase regulatory-like domain-containing protein [bacterium]